MVGFGQYCGRAREWVYNQDRQHCEWVSRQESSNRALLEFQEFVRVAESREKRKELGMREKILEENRRKKEMEEVRRERKKEKGGRKEESGGEGGR